MTFDDAALFLSQDIIERALNEFNKQNLTNYEPLSNIIEEWLQDYREKNSISDDSTINTEPLTKEELIEGLRPEVEHGVVDYKVLLAFQKLRKLVDAMRKPTFATRFNS
jgi:transposase-like protein